MSQRVPFACPSCHQRGRVRPELMGRSARCRDCGAAFRLPAHLRIPCPECQTILRVAAQAVGHRVGCKFCDHDFRVRLEDALEVSAQPLSAPPGGRGALGGSDSGDDQRAGLSGEESLDAIDPWPTEPDPSDGPRPRSPGTIVDKTEEYDPPDLGGLETIIDPDLAPKPRKPDREPGTDLPRDPLESLRRRAAEADDLTAALKAARGDIDDLRRRLKSAARSENQLRMDYSRLVLDRERTRQQLDELRAELDGRSGPSEDLEAVARERDDLIGRVEEAARVIDRLRDENDGLRKERQNWKAGPSADAAKVAEAAARERAALKERLEQVEAERSELAAQLEAARATPPPDPGQDDERDTLRADRDRQATESARLTDLCSDLQQRLATVEQRAADLELRAEADRRAFESERSALEAECERLRAALGPEGEGRAEGQDTSLGWEDLRTELLMLQHSRERAEQDRLGAIEQLEAVRGQLAEIGPERDRKDARIAELESELDRQRADLDLALDRAQTELAEARAEADRLEAEWRHRLDQAESARLESADGTEALGRELAEARAELDRLGQVGSEAAEEARREIEDRDRLIESLRADLDQRRAEADGLREEVDRLGEECRRLQSECDGLRTEAQGAHASSADRLATVEAERDELRSDRDRLAARVQELEDQTRIEVEDRVRLQSEADETGDKLRQLTERLDSAHTEREELSTLVDRLRDQAHQAGAELAEARQKLDDLTRERDHLAGEAARIGELTGALAEAEAAVGQAVRQREDSIRVAHELRAELEGRARQHRELSIRLLHLEKEREELIARVETEKASDLAVSRSPGPPPNGEPEDREVVQELDTKVDTPFQATDQAGAGPVEGPQPEDPDEIDYETKIHPTTQLATEPPAEVPVQEQDTKVEPPGKGPGQESSYRDLLLGQWNSESFREYLRRRF